MSGLSRGAAAGLRLALAVVAAWSALARDARAQATWEYTPYRVRVAIELAPVPQLPPSLRPSLVEHVAARADAMLGAVWQVEPAAAPPHPLTGGSLDELTADALVARLTPADLEADKLALVVIDWHAGTYPVAVRELDCRTRQLGPVIRRVAVSPAALPGAVWDAVLASFVPLGRIERVEEDQVVVRLRAAGLAVDPSSPVLLDAGAALRPVLRRNDRNGQPLKNGIQAVPWTLLAATRRDGALVECTLYSGYRSPIPARGSVRSERLALAARPVFPSTRLVLRARGESAKPLAGYEIYSRKPGQEESTLLGSTDLTGAINLARGTGGVEILYLKHGKQLLARLPVVFGQADELVAELADDDPRLEAEGFVAALSSRALDLVARREVLAARIRARIKEGNLAEAQRLLDEFRQLETRDDLRRDLSRYRQRASAPDKLTQQRIDKLLSDAQQTLLLRALGDELLTELTRELAAAKTGGSPRGTSG